MKSAITIFTTILFLINSSNILQAQSVSESTSELIESNIEAHSINQYPLTLSSNIPKSLLKLSFWVYKNTLSSQDFGSCSFSPSCSQFAVNAMEKKGLVKGYLMTFDRLARCHGMAAHKYELDESTGLLIDPVQ